MIYIYKDKNDWCLTLSHFLNKRDVKNTIFTDTKDVGDKGIVFMHADHLPLEERDKNKAIMIELDKRPGLKLIPTAREVALYDNKVAQFQEFGNWMPETILIENKETALANIGQLGFPFISKSRQGAGASNARLIRTPKQAKEEVNAVFSKTGLDCYKGGCQKDYVLWQKWLPNLEMNWRVIVIAYKYFVVTKRWNEDGTDFVNDNGKIKTLINLDDEAKKVISFAEKFAKSNRFGWVAIDIVESNNNLYVLETSVGWPMWWLNSGCVFKKENNELKPVFFARSIFRLVAELIDTREIFDKPLPTVAWLYDVDYWAYYQRCKNLSKNIPGYNHKFIKIAGISYSALAKALNNADVIVCMFHGWIEYMKPWQKKNVLGISGARSFLKNENYIEC